MRHPLLSRQIAQATDASGRLDHNTFFALVESTYNASDPSDEMVETLARRDALTELPNRLVLEDILRDTIAEAARRSEAFDVVRIGVDRFKEINDLHGHQVGDQALRAIAVRLGSVAGEAFLARLGGDEFVLVTKSNAETSGVELAERPLSSIPRELEVAGRSVSAGLSLGVATFPTDGTEPKALLGNTDIALQRAKGDGGGIRFFDAETGRRVRARRLIRSELVSAIEKDQLLLHFQPQASISGQIIGFEALTRWRHESRGSIQPSDFIPVAEESGAILEIGDWVLREACREAAGWRNPLRLSVNLSPAQFTQGDLPGLVHSALFETGLTPSGLEVEVTEGVLVNDFDRVISILRRIKSLGVAIALDDFGTGYSSLSYLHSFPFDEIKIDKACVTNLSRHKDSTTILRAILALGRGLELPVLAEGVETRDQLNVLRKEGCGFVQGYLIGRPAPIAQYSELVMKRGRLSDSGR